MAPSSTPELYEGDQHDRCSKAEKPILRYRSRAWQIQPWIVPIPGTTKLNRLEENIGSVTVALTANDLADIEDAVSVIAVQGARYSPQQEARIDR
ncbi:hypothetical protein LB519_16600 [Mesorhizobium sp. AD1-1]|uniref:hypothetical protein n=1 Tax=Mesorhizobium sp. AD1-1 TaxID=2876621 RepID=UPI001CCA0D8A|nr:hypothetical protein [Mesorhizobium sp. AD1-1]MBZ9719465.1 hypothetical protein [Mesorhizobium sp. AD1-1]